MLQSYDRLSTVLQYTYQCNTFTIEVSMERDRSTRFCSLSNVFILFGLRVHGKTIPHSTIAEHDTSL